ncbi:hypothetical protein PL263_20165 [Methylomonas sp. EFPC3]|uniref:hypothetical protein n=1 Tax=Methylomonas sp. EFPC3 TaxID=3021710 RepID=UPI002416A95D|nr:hypothetical protein [Methylomonas sp. EFPC3]WFP50390.1 hypothetical protein PL263_20165 [Methylomonas sp. EFPC3]
MRQFFSCDAIWSNDQFSELIGGSVSLVETSWICIGDALVYGFSIYVVARGARMKAKAALFKGGIMAAFGLFVLGQVIDKMIFPQIPVYEAIGTHRFVGTCGKQRVFCFALAASIR